jgi:hypothetical protein
VGNYRGNVVVIRAGNPVETGGGALSEIPAGQKEALS